VRSGVQVQYVFLYLLPTLAEAAIVCGVFVGEFKVPLLAACAISGAFASTHTSALSRA